MNIGPHGIWYLLLLLPILVLLGWWYYRVTVPTVSQLQRRALLLLRVGVLALVAIALAKPVFNWESESEAKPIWLRLVDYSASMDQPDGLEGATRLESALQMLNLPAWNDVAGSVDLVTAFFADSILADTAGVPREGTDLYAALAAATRLPQVPAAVLLFTDGGANAAGDPGARSWPFPVYSVCIGDSGLAPDRALVALDAPSLATAGDSVRVAVRAMATGDAATAPITFKAAGRTINQIARLDGGGRQQEIEFVFRPDTAGLYQISAEVATAGNEVSRANNRIETRIYVEPRRQRTLLAAAAPNWETAFLARQLAANDRLDVQIAYQSLAGRGNFAGWPAGFDSLAAFDLIILADMPPVRWAGLSAPLDRYLRERAGGLMVLVGPQSAAGEWSDLQQRIVNLRWVTQPAGVLSVTDPVWLTAAGRFHPAATLGTTADEAAAIWSGLPLLTGLVPTSEQGAAALVACQIGGRTWPVVLAGHTGRSRTLTTLGYPLWRWDFTRASEPGKPDWANAFWRASTRWLTSTHDGDRLTVLPGQNPLPAFSPPELRAVLVDESWQPLSGATVVAEIRDTAGTTVQTFELRQTERGRYAGAGRSLSAGEYSYIVRAQLDTVEVASARGRFSAIAASREALSPGARPLLLDKLAAATGGKRLSTSSWYAEFDSLPRATTRQSTFGNLRLWESPWLLVLALLLLGAEWILRRRFQML